MILFYALAAWKRTRQSTYFFVILSCIISLGIFVYDETADRAHMSKQTYYWVYCVRYALLIISSISSLIAMLALIKGNVGASKK
jgi:hypothetical protein